MNAKEFDEMEADLTYRKHLKYSQADLDEKLREQRDAHIKACEDLFMYDEYDPASSFIEAILNAEIEK